MIKGATIRLLVEFKGVNSRFTQSLLSKSERFVVIKEEDFEKLFKEQTSK